MLSTAMPFRRSSVLLPLLFGAVLIVGGYVITEVRRTATRELSERARDRQDRLRVLAELIYANSDAESAQRGYLLTENPDYLEPFAGSEAQAHRLMDDLLRRYAQRDAVELPVLRAAADLMDRKFAEIKQTLKLMQSLHSPHEALRLVHSGEGLFYMRALRAHLEGMRDRERERVYADIAEWRRQVELSRMLSTASMLVSLGLAVVVAWLVLRSLRRRAAQAAELDARVAARTWELSELAEHSRHVIEEERRRLSRELHDELGGLLVGLKMDLAQLARRVDLSEPALARRWAGIQGLIAQGIELKRRVIEELRPTMLDTMGLAAALKGQAEVFAERAGLGLHLDVEESADGMDPQVSIELFRILQESLTNIGKHANARNLRVTLATREGMVTLGVEDDGRGMHPPGAGQVTAHGLLGMRHRAQALGGSFAIERVEPQGTRVVVRVPLSGPPRRTQGRTGQAG